MTERPWYADHVRLVEVGDFLVERGDLSTPQEVMYYVSEPWKWTAEHDEMLGAAMDEHIRSLPVVRAA